MHNQLVKDRFLNLNKTVWGFSVTALFSTTNKNNKLKKVSS